MTVLNVAEIEKFSRKHRDAATALHKWVQMTGAATWQNIVDVRRTFASADGVAIKQGGAVTVVMVFNVKGNHYRLITVVDFERSIVRVVEILTHAEYDNDRWKERI
jgi:mRNA interferase HigB